MAEPLVDTFAFEALETTAEAAQRFAKLIEAFRPVLLRGAASHWPAVGKHLGRWPVSARR